MPGYIHVLVEVLIRSPPTKNKNITSSVASRVETKSLRFRSFVKITFVFCETASTVVRSKYGLLYYNTKIVPRYQGEGTVYCRCGGKVETIGFVMGNRWP